ncbi:MAG: hypothetical protein AABX12_04845 [Nanoarchaeota archaeon]
MSQKKAYVPLQHIVRPHNPWGADLGVDTNVKVYTMVPENEPDFIPGEMRKIRDNVEIDLVEGRIDKRLGLGFSIISDGVVNVCMWGGDYPSLLNQSLYTFERKDLKNFHFGEDLKRRSTEEIGSFCCWELGVVGHEGAAWRRYLLSPQSKADRIAYLEDTIEGLVGR